MFSMSHVPLLCDPSGALVADESRDPGSLLFVYLEQEPSALEPFTELLWQFAQRVRKQRSCVLIWSWSHKNEASGETAARFCKGRVRVRTVRGGGGRGRHPASRLGMLISFWSKKTVRCRASRLGEPLSFPAVFQTCLVLSRQNPSQRNWGIMVMPVKTSYVQFNPQSFWMGYYLHGPYERHVKCGLTGEIGWEKKNKKATAPCEWKCFTNGWVCALLKIKRFIHFPQSLYMITIK